MPQNLDLEIKVIKKFIEKSKQDRYIKFISTPKNRHKFIRELAHFNDFRTDLFQKVGEISTQIVVSILHKYRVTDKFCYVISENIELDTKTLDIETAIQSSVGYDMATILVFGDADMVFYEGESTKTRYISRMRN